MSQNLDLIISARNTSDAAFKQMQVGLAGVDTQLKKLVPSTEAWSSAQQKAAQRMETMHEAALKMNEGMGTTDDKAQRLSGTINTMSSTLTSTASAMGMPIGQLGALNAAADVAGLGMNKLKTTTVGFNAASIAVAGAALAVGTAVGSWLRTFPAVAKAADDATEALVRLFTAQKDLDAQANATQGLADFQKRMAASNDEAMKRQVQSMREAGASIGQILDMMDGKRETSKEKLIAGLTQEEAALKKFNNEQQKAADLAEKVAEKVSKSIAMAQVTWTGAFMQMPAAIAPAKVAVFDFTAAIVDLEAAAKKSLEQQAKDWKELDKAIAAALLTASNERAWDAVRAAEEGLKASAEEAFKLADALHEVGDLLKFLGVSAESSLAELVEGLTAAAEGAASLMAGLASGNPAQIIAGINGIANAIKGLVQSESGLNRIIGGALVGGPVGAIAAFLFGGGPDAGAKLAQDIRNLQTAFVNASGGLFVLQEKAARAGVSLEAMWNARTVEEYERAVNRVTAAIELNEEATRLVEEAMERYGLTIDQMGPRFAAQKLSEQAVRLYQDFRLLIAAGADLTTVITAMGPAINEFVQASLAAGIALPEFMRPAIEEMIRLGLLFDENGEKITDISQLTFTETLEAGVQRLIDKIEDLVDALLGIPNNIDTTIAVRVVQTGGVNTGGSPSNNLPDLDNNPQTPMAEGGWFPYRPGGYPVTVGEAGDEAIIPESKMAGIIAQAMVQAGGGGAGPTVVNVYIGGNRLDGVIQRRIDAGLIRVDG